MRVNIDEIKEAGLDRHWEVTRESLDGIVQGDRSGWPPATGEVCPPPVTCGDEQAGIASAATIAAQCHQRPTTGPSLHTRPGRQLGDIL